MLRPGGSESGGRQGGTDQQEFAPAGLLRVLGTFPAPMRYRVAFSGGPDSLALLHAISRVRPRLGAPLSAVHVNHGLHRDAGAWQAACAGWCRDLELAFEAVSVDARRVRGESPEAAARHARYEALAGQMAEGDMLLMAHHRDDQAETLMLQLLRGAGPHGLAAMPAVASFHGGWIARPLLGVSREALSRYLGAHELVAVSDPANEDLRFDRNYLRREVMPVIAARWPAAASTLARAAAHQAEASSTLDAWAEADLETLLDRESGTMSCAGLSALPAARRASVLRAWLRGRGLSVPTTAQLERIVCDVLEAARDRTPLVKWHGGEVRRYRGRLHAMAPLAEAAPVAVEWHLESPLELPAGRLTARLARGEGLAARCCPDATVEVRSRCGGERCRPADGAHTRSLKKLLQERGIPPWRRVRLPLVFADGALVAVPGVCVSSTHAAARDEPGWVIDWAPAAATGAEGVGGDGRPGDKE